MTDRKQRIEQEVERTLDALGQAPRLTASPWFATRVQNRLNTDTAPAARPTAGFGLWGLLRPALLTVIIALNVFSALFAIQRSDRATEARDYYVSGFASEYAYTNTDAFFALDD